MRIELTGAPKLSAADFILTPIPAAPVTAIKAPLIVTVAPLAIPTQEKLAGITIKGTAGEVATLKGTAGSDYIEPLAKYNYIDGEGGRDFIKCGTGVDHFIYNAITDSSTNLPDHIAGFQVGVDKIDLSALATAYGVSKGSLSLVGATFSGEAGQVRQFEALSGTTKLTRIEIDLNGDKLADMRIELTGAPKLSGIDFLL